MTKRNHHYVPQFYLRFFSSDRNLVKKPRRIHMFNIKDNFVKENISIKEQCYKRNFYGDTDYVENILSTFESAYSRVLFQVLKSEKIPPPNTYEYRALLDFVIVQHLRSKRHADFQEDIWDSMMKSFLYENIDHMSSEQWENVLGKGESLITKDDLNNYRIGYKNSAVFSLSFASEATHYALSDLSMHLVLSSGEHHFITSDNPVVLYNQYFQGMKDMSCTGFVSMGLQIFLPLSPHCLLILFDKGAYYLPDTLGVTRGISPVDLQYINLLQFVNADQNIFFDNFRQVPELEKIYLLSRRYRKEKRARTLVFDEEKSRADMIGSSLIQSYVEDLNVGLSLQFIKLKRSLRKLTLREKLVKRFRKEMPPEYLPKYEEPPNMPQVFKKRKGESG